MRCKIPQDQIPGLGPAVGNWYRNNHTDERFKVIEVEAKKYHWCWIVSMDRDGEAKRVKVSELLQHYTHIVAALSGKAR